MERLPNSNYFNFRNSEGLHSNLKACVRLIRYYVKGIDTKHIKLNSNLKVLKEQCIELQEKLINYYLVEKGADEFIEVIPINFIDTDNDVQYTKYLQISTTDWDIMNMRELINLAIHGYVKNIAYDVDTKYRLSCAYDPEIAKRALSNS